MWKSKSSLLLLLFGVAAPICLPNPVASVGGIECPCESSVAGAAGVLFICPAGDGDRLDANGLIITVTVRDCAGPVPGIPASDIWLVGCHDLLTLCGGSAAISATGPTDANGVTTIAGAVAAGGCDVGGVHVVVQGVVIGAGVCGEPCIPSKMKSADISRDLVVDLVDFAIFGGPSGYPSPPSPYNECIDYTAPFGTVTLPDFAKYAIHSSHHC